MARDIAVVGMGCVLPGASAPEAFWQNCLAQKVFFREAQGRWQWSRYLSADGAPDTTHTLSVAQVEPAGSSPYAWLRHAAQGALGRRPVPARAALVLGATGVGLPDRVGFPRALEGLEAQLSEAGLPGPLRQQVVAGLRAYAEDSAGGEDELEACLPSAYAERLARDLGLDGPRQVVDSGFASGLAALDLAMRTLRDGQADWVLCGAFSEPLTPAELVLFSKLGALARGHMAPFDALTDGTLLGEGAVFFALRRLEDAQAQEEPVLATLLGVGASSDGFGKALTAPRPEGQRLSYQRAYEDAAVDPASVGFVECHATGTQVGDAAEVEGLGPLFAAAAPQSIALGSAKAGVGHLRAAAGAVGVMRAVLALHHGQVPPQPQVRSLNPRLRLDASPFFVPLEAAPLVGRGGAPARAAVSAISLGGTNFHLVLEAPGRSASPRPPPPARGGPQVALVGVAAQTPAAPSYPALKQALLAAPPPADPPRRFARPPELPERWRLPSSVVPQIDPGQLRVLRAAELALEDAGYDPMTWDRARVGVFVAHLPNHGQKVNANVRVHLVELAAELERRLAAGGVALEDARAHAGRLLARAREGLPPISEETLPGLLPNIAAARVTREFDFRGPQLVFELGAASTLSALEAASLWLRGGTCDAVVVCAARAGVLPEHHSSSDAAAPGEAVAGFVLRRLADAAQTGDSLRAKLSAPHPSHPVHDGAPARARWGSCGAASSALDLLGALAALEAGPGGGALDVVSAAPDSRARVGLQAPEAQEAPAADFFPIALFAAPSLEECVEGAEALLRRAEAGAPEDFPRLLQDAQKAAEAQPEGHRLAVVAFDPADLRQRFQSLVGTRNLPAYEAALRQRGVFWAAAREAGPVAALFPGQGPQYANMLRGAASHLPSLASTLRWVDATYAEITGHPLTPTYYVDEGQSFQQRDEDIHPAVFAVNVAVFRFLFHHGFRPDFLLGQSAGELAALVAAGVISFRDGLRAIRERTVSVLSLDLPDNGQTVALKCSAERARALLAEVPGRAGVAADNGPSACIVSGETGAMAAVMARCQAEGIESQLLPISHAYHSEIIAPAGDRFGRLVAQLNCFRARLPILSTVTGELLPQLGSEALREHLTRQYVEPVHFRPAIELAYRRGVRVFVECGPKWGLSTLTQEVLGERPHHVQPMLHPKVGDAEQFFRGAAALWVRGLLTPRIGFAAQSPARVAAASRKAPSAPTPVVESQVVGAVEEDVQDVIRLLVRHLSDEIGYPEDMFEPESDFDQLGVDSIKRMRVVGLLQAKLGLSSDPSFRIAEHPTVLSLARHFAKQRRATPGGA